MQSEEETLANKSDEEQAIFIHCFRRSIRTSCPFLESLLAYTVYTLVIVILI